MILKVLKQDLSDLLISKISKISAEMKKLLSDQGYLTSILSDGAKEAKKFLKKILKK